MSYSNLFQNVLTMMRDRKYNVPEIKEHQGDLYPRPEPDLRSYIQSNGTLDQRSGLSIVLTHPTKPNILVFFTEVWNGQMSIGTYRVFSGIILELNLTHGIII